MFAINYIELTFKLNALASRHKNIFLSLALFIRSINQIKNANNAEWRRKRKRRRKSGFLIMGESSFQHEVMIKHSIMEISHLQVSNNT
jgi:hypothetical protein